MIMMQFEGFQTNIRTQMHAERIK